MSKLLTSQIKLAESANLFVQDCPNPCLPYLCHGGDPVQATQTYSSNPAVSPDCKLLACLWKSDKSNSFMHIALLPVAGGTPVKLFAAKANGYVRWTSDGRALFYTTMENDVTNIWMQPLDGSPATQITKFIEGSIAGFDISPDGKKSSAPASSATTFLL